MTAPTPVIDLFAGPGGLSEGFSRHGERNWLRVAGNRLTGPPRGADKPFRIALSIEKDPIAHSTLELRALARNIDSPRQKALYQRFLLGQLSRDELFEGTADAGYTARMEAWNATLGTTDEAEVDKRITKALAGRSRWVLIGGPPCQAYSLAGRSRNKGVKGYRPEQDERHFLYQEYLRIVAKHQPPVFVMENVKGLLSSRVEGESMFERIATDLQAPGRAVGGARNLRYRLYPIAAEPDLFQGHLWTDGDSPSRFVLKMENHGVPQRRHRVILLGVRSDVSRNPLQLLGRDPVSADVVLDGLPRLRSALSRNDSTAAWKTALAELKSMPWLKRLDPGTSAVIRSALERALATDGDLGSEAVATDAAPRFAEAWYKGNGLVLNHTARGHIVSDLHRYMFAAAYAETHGRSPTLSDFPRELLPNHKNAAQAIETGGLFDDRFRVQIASAPSTTITSHISKDGHYYIHYDPTQCRALTVREAARLQTFPDDYFFCGPRTEQYRQVGNAVPPLLAVQVAAVVADLLG